MIVLFLQQDFFAQEAKNKLEGRFTFRLWKRKYPRIQNEIPVRTPYILPFPLETYNNLTKLYENFTKIE